ncbi:MAG: hypothetical protein LBH07_00180, partial [Treponema sp.]|nr:hypothetical protein [Treponema sp.]
MKKIIAAFFVFAVLAPETFAQTDNSLLNLNNYAEIFGFQRGVVDPTSEYIFSAPRVERRNFSHLDGDDVQIDTPLEFALLSYYSQPVLNIRPAQADAILPKNNPKLADQKLGAAVFQEI